MMDPVVNRALEEICSQGPNGLTLRTLWSKIHHHVSSNGLPLCTDVKKALWSNLLHVPSLRFEREGVPYDAGNPRVQSVEDSEAMELKIVAAEHLFHSFVGIYDIKASDAGISQPQRRDLERNAGISQPQRRVLERLAVARTDGVTQNELAKELVIKNNKMYNILRDLETRGLIVRQSTLVREIEAGNEECKSGLIVNTNMVHLYRYAKHLGHLQRLEITKKDKGFADNDNADREVASGECVSEEHIKDYVPAIRAICDRLEKAKGKVLVVSDIKQELGYRKTRGHRAWREILEKMKAVSLVEAFATVNEKDKEVKCIRLLKNFSPETFMPKSYGGGGDLDTEQQGKLVKRGQITDQLLELPIEQQIYDMIDAEGSKGLPPNEVYKRLGINNKQYYRRILKMVSRFRMHLDSEALKRGVVYRVWTTGNYNAGVTNTPPGKSKYTMVEKLPTHALAGQSINPVSSANDTWLDSNDLQSEANDIVPDAEVQIVTVKPTSNALPLETSLSGSPAPQRRRSYTTYPCIGLNTVNSLREQRILEKLQEEKVLIKAELHRLLESIEHLENKQGTTMDMKTLERRLNSLQKDGYCKCISFAVPSATTFGRKRTIDVILHPSVYGAEDLSDRVHARLILFEKQIRSHSSSEHKRGKSHKAIPVLNDVERINTGPRISDQSATCEAMKNNGFIFAKMVRAKLLHVFLWGYLTGLPGWDEALKDGHEQKNPHSSCKLFELDAAIKAMPLELFLQVGGSNLPPESMVEKCRNGLCLSDLPRHEYMRLMDTRAMGRLSFLIDILRRLKLIRLIGGDVPVGPHTTLSHSLEFKPYIEEPVRMVLPYTGVDSFDLRPHVRHDFVLASKISVDDYWKTLEYCYAASDPKAALHAFPGSTVREVFRSRSWASIRVMTTHQRDELFKLVAREDLDKKISFKKCEKIAENLNLTLEQVLRVFYDKRKKNKLKLAVCAKEPESLALTHASSSSKRKKSLKRKLSVNNERSLEKLGKLKQAKHANDTTKEQNSLKRLINEIDEANMLISEIDGQRDVVNDDLARNQDENGHFYSAIHDRALSKLQSSLQCQKRFSWTENKDRESQGVSGLTKYGQSDVGDEPHELDENKLCSPCTRTNELKKDGGKREAPTRRARSRLPKSYSMLMNKVKDFGTQAYKSLAVSNAIELSKLIFLSTAKAPDVQIFLAETLRRYSEHDLITAYNYLRDKHFMVKGNDIGRSFLNNIFSSPFPNNTGKRVVQMSRWLHERENDLLNNGVDLSADLQCGDVLQLCVLICSGEISMFPCLPDEGIGEIEDLKKRKCDGDEVCSVEITKKPKLLDNETFTRKGKGFPGIQLFVSRCLISRVHDEIALSGSNLECNSQSSGRMEGITKSNGASESTWEAMTCYARHLVSSAQELSPNLFKTVYSAIQKSGDQGLSMEGVSNIIDMQGEKMPELIVEVLEAFGHALKVNAFDSVHVVDSLYRSKYMLTSMASHQNDLHLKVPESLHNEGEPLKLQHENQEGKRKNLLEGASTHLTEVHTSSAEVQHRVTILNHSEVVPQPMSEVQKNSEIETLMLPRKDPHEEICKFRMDDFSGFYKPILPWLNGDGTINNIVYKGLVRRVLGIVMQNPGILEEHIIRQMNVLNPQSCRNLLELMILDSHIIVRKMYQSISNEPPAMLHRLVGCSSSKRPKLILRHHLFANPKSINYL